MQPSSRTLDRRMSWLDRRPMAGPAPRVPAEDRPPGRLSVASHLAGVGGSSTALARELVRRTRVFQSASKTACPGLTEAMANAWRSPVRLDRCGSSSRRQGCPCRTRIETSDTTFHFVDTRTVPMYVAERRRRPNAKPSGRRRVIFGMPQREVRDGARRLGQRVR